MTNTIKYKGVIYVEAAKQDPETGEYPEGYCEWCGKKLDPKSDFTSCEVCLNTSQRKLKTLNPKLFNYLRAIHLKHTPKRASWMSEIDILLQENHGKPRPSEEPSGAMAFDFKSTTDASNFFTKLKDLLRKNKSKDQVKQSGKTVSIG